MQKTIIIFFACIFCFISSIYAQKIGEIKQKAQENKSNKSSSNNSSSPNDNSSSGSSESTGSVGGDIAVELVGNILEGILRGIFSGPNLTPEQRAMLQAQKDEARALRMEERKLKEEEREQKRAEGKLNPLNSLELMFDYGTVPNYYQSFRPRLRARSGIVSTDIRVSSLRERRLEYVDKYDTFDWQILQFNTFNTPQFTWRFGAGIMNERTTGTVFPEFATSAEITFQKQKFRFVPEFRYAYDFNEAALVSPRLECNGEVSYAVVNQKQFKLYLGLQAMYARYYESVNVWSAGMGIKLKVH